MAHSAAGRWLRGTAGVGCLVGWALLVGVAVRAGRAGRGSRGGAADWWLTAGAVLAAVVLLLVAVQMLLGALRPTGRPGRPPGRRVRR